MYCIGCGEPLRNTSGVCPSCRSPIVGASFLEEISLPYGKGIVVPPVCCCCLAPRQITRKEELSTITFRLDKRYTHVPIPWCYGCRDRGKIYGMLATIGWILAGLALYFGFEPWVGDAAVIIAFFGGLSGLVAASMLLPRFVSNTRLPGHVPNCDAVSGSAGADRATIQFRNRAFARIWQELNSGVASRAPSLAWAEPSPRAGSTPPAERRDAKPASAVETRARVRDQLQAGKPGLTSRIGFGSRPAAADRTGEILDFVAKSVEIGESGLAATEKNGAKRELPFGAVESVLARKTPDDPPFSGTIFLDLLPRPTGDGPARPLRILPTTRVNYGSLSGSGTTSHENFRRLVRYLKERSEGILVEAGSIPYLEEGRGFPPALSTPDAIIEFDSRYR
jgi:hypothetical protein